MSISEDPWKRFESQQQSQGQQQPQFDQSPPHAQLKNINDLPPQYRGMIEEALKAVQNGSMNQGGNLFTLEQPYSSASEQSFGPFSQSSQPSQDHSYWMRWEYSPEEWQAFDKLDWGYFQRRIRIIRTVIFLLYFGIEVATALLLRQVYSSLVSSLPLIFAQVIFLFMAILIPFLMTGRLQGEAKKRHIARQTGPRHVTIGTITCLDQAIWIAGLQIPLQEQFLDLVQAEIRIKPTHLCLTTQNTQTRQSNILRILVPGRHEAEAMQLVERFRAETIGARNKTNTVAEPV